MLCSRDLGGIDCYLRIFYHTSGTIPKYSQTANQQWPNCSLLLFKAWLVDRCPHLQTAGVLVLLWNPRRRVLPERSNPREENWPTLGQFVCISWWAVLLESHAFQLLLPWGFSEPRAGHVGLRLQLLPGDLGLGWAWEIGKYGPGKVAQGIWGWTRGTMLGEMKVLKRHILVCKCGYSTGSHCKLKLPIKPYMWQWQLCFDCIQYFCIMNYSGISSYPPKLTSTVNISLFALHLLIYIIE